MNSITNLAKSFSELLLIEVEHTQGLLSILEEEYQLLRGTNPAPLVRLTQHKQQQIELLETVVSEHNQLLGQMGYPPDRLGVETFLENLADPTQVRELWSRLENLLEASRKQNTINGSILALSKQQVSHALDLLHGVSVDQKTYGRAGESQSNHLSSSLGKA
ncbi:MAG: flagellar protein FlgN [Pseudomonadota bacterium]